MILGATLCLVGAFVPMYFHHLMLGALPSIHDNPPVDLRQIFGADTQPSTAPTTTATLAPVPITTMPSFFVSSSPDIRDVVQDFPTTQPSMDSADLLRAVSQVPPTTQPSLQPSVPN